MTPEQKKKLDDIVTRMDAAGADPDEIRSVVTDYKKKYQTQSVSTPPGPETSQEESYGSFPRVKGFVDNFLLTSIPGMVGQFTQEATPLDLLGSGMPWLARKVGEGIRDRSSYFLDKAGAATAQAINPYTEEDTSKQLMGEAAARMMQGGLAALPIAGEATLPADMAISNDPRTERSKYGQGALLGQIANVALPFGKEIKTDVGGTVGGLTRAGGRGLARAAGSDVGQGVLAGGVDMLLSHNPYQAGIVGAGRMLLKPILKGAMRTFKQAMKESTIGPFAEEEVAASVPKNSSMKTSKQMTTPDEIQPFHVPDEQPNLATPEMMLPEEDVLNMPKGADLPPIIDEIGIPSPPDALPFDPEAVPQTMRANINPLDLERPSTIPALPPGLQETVDMIMNKIGNRRAHGTNPRALATNLRARGLNPRARK